MKLIGNTRAAIRAAATVLASVLIGTGGVAAQDVVKSGGVDAHRADHLLHGRAWDRRHG